VCCGLAKLRTLASLSVHPTGDKSSPVVALRNRGEIGPRRPDFRDHNFVPRAAITDLQSNALREVAHTQTVPLQVLTHLPSIGEIGEQKPPRMRSQESASSFASPNRVKDMHLNTECQ